jgi:hypothetical protein
VINLTTNITSLAVFLLNGQVVLLLGLAGAACNMAGNWFGSGLAITKGAKIVRPVILIVLALLLVGLYKFGFNGYREAAEWGAPGDHNTLIYEGDTYELVGVLGKGGLNVVNDHRGGAAGPGGVQRRTGKRMTVKYRRLSGLGSRLGGRFCGRLGAGLCRGCGGRFGGRLCGLVGRAASAQQQTQHQQQYSDTLHCSHPFKGK